MDYRVSLPGFRALLVADAVVEMDLFSVYLEDFFDESVFSQKMMLINFIRAGIILFWSRAKEMSGRQANV